MSDEVTRILMESRGVVPLTPEDSPLVAAADFDEQAYLKRNPDVAQGIARGMFPSGYDHYKNYGRYEGRALLGVEIGPRDKIVFSTERALDSPLIAALERVNIDAVLLSSSGGIMIVGWAYDSTDPLDSITLNCNSWQLTMSAAGLIRVRRQDVESAYGGETSYSYGFFGLHFEKASISAPVSCEVTIVTRSGRSCIMTISPINQTDSGLRDAALSYLAEAKFFSNYQLEAISNVSRGFGNQMVLLNRAITTRFVANPYVERFGSRKTLLQGSIIVCLYGRAEYLFLQNALFSNQPGFDDYEFIYVSNSPELAEVLLREAKLASHIYGQRITIVLLEGNAGFGAANNAATKAAQSSRILIVNPDVFPRDLSWAQKHTSLLEARPKEETDLFGVPLYYDDGSLMHGGMYFELDTGVLSQGGNFERLTLVRVEHYGKGAPESVKRFTEPRQVPAVTGAFISCDRAWFEKLGGFTEDYIFGHYEDADLCLKSLVQEKLPRIHDLRLWHLEGKGSTRRPVHEGGSLVNRWLFSFQWSGLIESSLLGPNPDLSNLKTIADGTVQGRNRVNLQAGGQPAATQPLNRDRTPRETIAETGLISPGSSFPRHSHKKKLVSSKAGILSPERAGE